MHHKRVNLDAGALAAIGRRCFRPRRQRNGESNQSPRFFRNKTRSIRAAAAAIEKKHGGQVPQTMAERTHCPVSAARRQRRWGTLQNEEGIVATPRRALSAAVANDATRSGNGRARTDGLIPRAHWTNGATGIWPDGALLRRVPIAILRNLRLCPSGKFISREKRAGGNHSQLAKRLSKNVRLRIHGALFLSLAL